VQQVACTIFWCGDKGREGEFLSAGLGGWGVGLCPVGQGHEVAVGGSGGVEFAGSFFELLAQVEELLFEFADAGLQGFSPVGASETAGPEGFLPEEL